MDFEVEGGWPRKRRLPPPSDGEIEAGCGLFFVLIAIAVGVIILCCAL